MTTDLPPPVGPTTMVVCRVIMVSYIWTTLSTCEESTLLTPIHARQFTQPMSVSTVTELGNRRPLPVSFQMHATLSHPGSHFSKSYCVPASPENPAVCFLSGIHLLCTFQVNGIAPHVAPHLASSPSTTPARSRHGVCDSSLSVAEYYSRDGQSAHPSIR